jgi:hypothetical protein
LAIVSSGRQNELIWTQLPILSLTVRAVDPDGNLISDAEKGACFSFDDREVCDADDGSNDGRIEIETITGFHRMAESRGPAGYSFGDYREFFLDKSGPTEISVSHLPLQTLIVHLVDAKGDPITDGSIGACFGMTGINACDADDGSKDGDISLKGVLPGQQILGQTRAAVGYALAEYQELTISLGGLNEATIVNRNTFTLTVNNVDGVGNPVTDNRSGACLYLVDPQTESGIAFACDKDDGVIDGRAILTVDAGTYRLQPYSAAFGFEFQGLPLDVVVGASQPNEVTVISTRLERITIFNVDENGARLANACFSNLYGQACDAEDGASDGATTLYARPGSLDIWQFNGPAGYTPAVQPITPEIVAGGPNEVIFVNNQDEPVPPPVEPSSLTIHKIDGEGNPLTDDLFGACFALTDGMRFACDSDDGSKDGIISMTARW